MLTRWTSHRAAQRIVFLFVMLSALTAFGVSARAADPSFPPFTGRVVDDAGVLSAATQNELTTRLVREERMTGDQVVVVTVKSLQGYSIEDFARELGNYWGIGRTSDNGVLLVVAPTERKVRIAVGYALESQLTDAASREIIDDQILPAFRRGDFNAGVLNGTTSILEILDNDLQNATPSDGWKLHRSADPMVWIGLGLMVIWVMAFGILYAVGVRFHHPPKNAYILRRTSRRDDLMGLPRSLLTHAGGGSYRGGTGGGGGGGFSGGAGGGFGGGGASGGW